MKVRSDNLKQHDKIYDMKKSKNAQTSQFSEQENQLRPNAPELVEEQENAGAFVSAGSSARHVYSSVKYILLSIMLFVLSFSIVLLFL